MAKKLMTLAAGASVLALTLSACGTSNPLDHVKVTTHGTTAAPEAEYKAPFAVASEKVRVIEEGDGDQIKDGDFLIVQVSVFDASKDNTLKDSTYTGSQGPIIVPINDRLKQLAPEIYNTFTKMKVGGTFAHATNQDQQAAAKGVTNATLAPGTATDFEVYTVTKKLPGYVEGSQAPAEAPFPAFTLDNGNASLKFEDNRGDAPTELKTKVLIEGNGATVKETDTLYVRYIGAQWSDGQVFDGNYNTQPISFSLQGVIKGWTQGLAGQKVGSRVELVIPGDLAYGNEAVQGRPSGTLVFVVDILDAAPQSEAQAKLIEQQKAQASAAASASASAAATPAASTNPAAATATATVSAS